MKLKKKYIFEALRVLFCMLLLVIIVFPFLWLVLSTFKVPRDIIKWPPTIWPREWTIENYITVWDRIPLATYFKNTIIYSAFTATLATLLDSFAGYAFARLKFRGRDKIFNLVLLTMMVPFQIIMIPLYLELNMIGILNTYVGLILPHIATAYGIFFMKSFYITLPQSLEEAARIDGMNEISIFWKIMFPLTKPAFITYFIFNITGCWNDLLYPLMMTSSADMRTLSAGLALFVGEGVRENGPAFAAALLSMLPLLVAYCFGQEYFVEGIAVSGMKE
ncbi:MAG TPA: carbohydrate ABC transporter permease [Candidatus Eisenbergiella stercorigallinarum]|uniref:Carbohydrate ABC transporter permease n=1 Tax=Candidatus Eisenbergiella stercorigallinarum TaxID=2838557 RepID=A0A9D2QZ19_9FIRM|nr:carbohydrate ABC transporter permease [Candidatus Eisenbergiella stercorigallinarum]